MNDFEGNFNENFKLINLWKFKDFIDPNHEFLRDIGGLKFGRICK